MKPAKFEYIAPRTTAEALSALAEYGDGAKVLAGGQSLVPLMNMRLARPEVIVDINEVAELDYVRGSDVGGLVIGSLTRQRQLEREAVVRDQFPVLTEAAELIGHFQIRNRGTIGGSLAHSDPAAELPAVMTAMDAEFVIAVEYGNTHRHSVRIFRDVSHHCVGAERAAHRDSSAGVASRHWQSRLRGQPSAR